jgi:hypothetical protein
MNPRSHKWFIESVAAGKDQLVAHTGSEVIDSWEDFWKFTISDATLAEMLRLGLEYPQAALHRWGLQGGPCPWVPQEAEKKRLRIDPRYSPFDLKVKG